MPSIQSASSERSKPGWVGAHTVKRSETCASQRVHPRLPPAPWSTSRGSPWPPTQACTRMPPTEIISSRGRMRRIMLQPAIPYGKDTARGSARRVRRPAPLRGAAGRRRRQGEGVREPRRDGRARGRGPRALGRRATRGARARAPPPATARGGGGRDVVDRRRAGHARGRGVRQRRGGGGGQTRRIPPHCSPSPRPPSGRRGPPPPRGGGRRAAALVYG